MKYQALIIIICLLNFKATAQEEMSMDTRSSVYEALIDYSMENQNLDYFKEPINSEILDTKVSDDGKFVTSGYRMAGSDRLLVTRSISGDFISQIVLIITPEVSKNGDVGLKTFTTLANHFNQTYTVKQLSRNWSRGKLTIEMQLKDDGMTLLTLY